MKPKIYAGIALMLALLVAGMILILGLARDALLPIYLLIFFLIYSAIGIFAMRKSLDDKIFAACIIMVIISISGTFYLTSLKSYHQVINLYGNPDNSPEISLMQAENTYYSVYADYLNQIVLQYQSNNKILENQLTQLKQLKLDQAMQQAVLSTSYNNSNNVSSPLIIVPETSYITYSYPDNGGVNDG